MDRHDPLTLGGRLYLRTSTFALEEGDWSDVPLSHSAQLYLYADARPTEHLRAYVKGRIDHSFSKPAVGFPNLASALGGEPDDRTKGNIDQLWLKFDVDRTLFVTVGQQPIRWGAARIWNPTDFINAQRRDPLAIFDARPGVSLVKLHWPIESTGTNLYAIAQFDDIERAAEVGGVLRAEQTFGPSELSATIAARKEQPLRMGMDYSVGAGPVELRFEGAALRGGNLHRWVGPLVPDPTDPIFPKRQAEDWGYQGVAGLEWGIPYGDEDSLYLTVEYFHNALGYANDNLYPWLLFQGEMTPLYLGRHYLAANVSLPRPGGFNDTTVLGTGIMNLSDKTAIIRMDYQVRVLTRLNVYCFVAGHVGDHGEFRFGFDLPPSDEVPGLENGLTIPPQWIDLGLWVSLDL